MVFYFNSSMQSLKIFGKLTENGAFQTNQDVKGTQSL